MSGIQGGIICLRDDVLFVESTRVHLSGGREHEVTPADRLLIELVQRGEGDLDRLAEAIECLTGSDGGLRSRLSAVANDRRSIVELVSHFDVEEPDVIVCCFTTGPDIDWARSLVQRLRRRQRVLFLGHDGVVSGPLARNISFERGRKAGRFGSFFSFIQWVRGTLRRFEGRRLVLCGPVDAILFGDLSPFFRTVAVADPQWPAPVGLGDFGGSEWVPDRLDDELRDLYFALRHGGDDCLDKLSRISGSSFALLEAHALRYSERVVVTATDHAAELKRLGAYPASVTAAHPFVARRPVESLTPAPTPDVLAVLVGGEADFESIAPLLSLLESIPQEERPFSQVAVAFDGAWARWRVEGQVASLTPWEGEAPGAARRVASLAVLGLTRNLLNVWRALAEPAPCYLVPSSRSHLLQEIAPPELLLGPIDAPSLSVMLSAVATMDGKERANALSNQRRFLRNHDLSAHLRALGMDASKPVGDELGTFEQGVPS